MKTASDAAVKSYILEVLKDRKTTKAQLEREVDDGFAVVGEELRNIQFHTCYGQLKSEGEILDDDENGDQPEFIVNCWRKPKVVVPKPTKSLFD